VAYRPGRLEVDTARALAMMTRVPGDFGVTYLPLVLLVDHLRGRNANVCVDACVLLKRIYALLGVDARITPVSVVVEPPGGGTSVYGQNPRWEASVFAGHCVLWLPQLQRVVDPTIQQFPELSGEDGPFIGRIGAASQALRDGELSVGSEIPIVRNGTQLIYTVTGAEALILRSEAARRAEQLNPKSAANLAGWALSIMVLPEIAPRIRTAPFARIHALMDAIDGAEVDAGPSGYRFLLRGPDGEVTPAWVDDIPLPASAE
jgi:hypothetical protein